MTFAHMPEKRLRQIASARGADDQAVVAQDESTLELLHELEGVAWGADLGADSDPEDAAGSPRRHADTRLQTALSEERLFLNLLKIHTEAETYLQEQGVNVLFLALGFLHWYEADSADKLRKAPLLLVPVELKRGGARDAFHLSFTGDELIQNLSLAARLKTDFSLDLPRYAVDASADADELPPLAAFFEAVQLYVFLTEARRRIPHLKIIITAGNHDSPGRLEAPAPFFSLLDACVVGQSLRNGDDIDLERLVLPMEDRNGAVAAWCIAIPFLRPSDVPRVEGAADPYAAGIEALYRQAFDYACSKRKAGQALIAIGHCHLTSAKVSEDSERRIMIGGVDSLSANIFDPQIAYVAHGHLHLAQKVGADPTRRYCGSPLPMSFSEIDYPHQVVVLDLDGEAATHIREIRIPRSVDLLRIPKQPASLDEVLHQLESFSPTDRSEAEWPYLQVRVLLTQPEPGLRAQIEAALAGKQVRLVRIETSYAKNSAIATAQALSVDELNSLAPADFFDRLYQNRFGTAPPAEILAAFTELLNVPAQTGISA